MKKSLLLLSMVTLGILVSVGFSGCGDAGGAAKTKSPIALYITQFGDPAMAQYNSDVCTASAETGECTFSEDEIVVKVKTKMLDPDPEDGTMYTDMIVKGYEVSYIRKDTGYEVPKTFTGSCNIYVPLDTDTDIPLIICRADMKEVPPLSYLWQLGYEPSTGLDTIHAAARVVIWGTTLAGQDVVSQAAFLNVDFANWADE